MWEIFSDGATPFAGVGDVIDYLQKGNQLQKPTLCDDEIYNDWMIPCWQLDPKKR